MFKFVSLCLSWSLNRGYIIVKIKISLHLIGLTHSYEWSIQFLWYMVITFSPPKTNVLTRPALRSPKQTRPGFLFVITILKWLLKLNIYKYQSIYYAINNFYRYTPLRENWLKIFTPIVEHLLLQVRFNTKSRNVEIRVGPETKDVANLQKAADFVKVTYNFR